MDIKDNHEEAAAGGRLALELCEEVRNKMDAYGLYTNMEAHD